MRSEVAAGIVDRLGHTEQSRTDVEAFPPLSRSTIERLRQIGLRAVVDTPSD